MDQDPTGLCAAKTDQKASPCPKEFTVKAGLVLPRCQSHQSKRHSGNQTCLAWPFSSQDLKDLKGSGLSHPAPLMRELRTAVL